MKIKGPGDYPGLPVPSGPGEGKPAGKLDVQKGVEKTADAQIKGKVHEPTGFEKGLSSIAAAIRTEGLQGEAMVGRVVDSVLEEILGKDFASRPDSAAMRQILSPFISQDEVLMNKLNNVLSRLEKKK
jgi:hypothetical protein